MQVLLELDGDQIEQVTKEGLMRGFESNRNFPEEQNYYEVNQAFMTLLSYYMLEKDFNKYIKPIIYVYLFIKR